MARLKEHSTATYCVVIAESGEMSLGLGDMDIHKQITEQYVSVADQVKLVQVQCSNTTFLTTSYNPLHPFIIIIIKAPL